MLLKRSLLIVLVFSLICPVAYADWAHRFVVFSGKIYVVTDEIIDQDKIDKKIGKVTRYSTREGTYRGNFSNVYPKGTQYYAIKGIETSQEIAVKTSEGYISASYHGVYKEKSSLGWYIIWIFLACIAILIGWPATYNKKNKT